MGAIRAARTVLLYVLLVLALQFGVIMAVNHDYAVAAGTFAVTGSQPGW